MPISRPLESHGRPSSILALLVQWLYLRCRDQIHLLAQLTTHAQKIAPAQIPADLFQSHRQLIFCVVLFAAESGIRHAIAAVLEEMGHIPFSVGEQFVQTYEESEPERSIVANALGPLTPIIGLSEIAQFGGTPDRRADATSQPSYFSNNLA